MSRRPLLVATAAAAASATGPVAAAASATGPVAAAAAVSSTTRLPQQQRDVQPLQPPMLLLPPQPPQGLAPTAAHGVLWQLQQFVGVRPYLAMPQPQPQQLVEVRPYLPMPQPQQFVGGRPYFPTDVGQTSASGPQAGAIDSSARDDNASFDTPAAALLSADQVEPRSRSPAPAIPRKLTLEEEQALCLVRQLAPGDVGFVGSSPCLVRLLKEGCEVVRRIVFDGVMGALHFVTGSSAWRVVFVELLRAGSFDELKVIVNVAC